MSRKTYELSQQTIQAINGHATNVAEEFGCIDKYIYAILAGTVTDPFAKFAWLFSSAVRAGCDVSPWLTELDRIRAKYTFTNALCHEEETAKFVKESSDVPIANISGAPLYQQLSEIDQAIRQGELTRAALLDAINREKEAENGGRTRIAGAGLRSVG